MYKKLYPLLALTVIVAIVSCSPRHSVPCTEKPLVGGDRDEHGCIASAGYQWSELLKDCIRPFEKGVKLTAADDAFSSYAAYLVFNADQSQVEVYLPKEKVRPLLSRKGDSWSSKKHKGCIVKKENGKWGVYLKGKLVFSE